MSRRRILIIGGSDAGTSAALSAQSLVLDCDLDVLLEDPDQECARAIAISDKESAP